MTFIPFLPRFHDAIKAGQKTCTARTKRYGKPGSLVQSPAGLLKLVSVDSVSLEVVRDKYWREEGCASPQDFENVWLRLHPRSNGAFHSQQKVWLHRFEALTKAKVSA